MIGLSVMEKIYVVIPNWNGADFISSCLTSLNNQTIQHEVIVVDNGSVDESIKIIETDFPKVILIKLPTNTGFAGGVNKGIEHALKLNAYAVALFNNDAVADFEWLSSLIKKMRVEPKSGIVTGKLKLFDKKHLDSTGDYYSVFGMPFPRGRNQIDIGQYDKSEEVFAASGGASLYRSDMLKEIGLFDERFFAYYEDVDISMRARLAGWTILYEPNAVAFHHLSATSSKLGSFTRYHATKNFFMLYTKNMPSYLYWKYLIFFLYQSVRLAASSLIKGGGIAYFKGLGRAIINLPYILSKRRAIQKNRKISIKEFDEILVKTKPPKIPLIS